MRLDGRLFSKLIDNFELHDLSISRFVESLKFAFMAHFFSEPLSLLAGYRNDLEGLSDTDWKWDQIIKNLTPEHIRMIRDTKSVMRYNFGDEALLKRMRRIIPLSTPF